MVRFRNGAGEHVHRRPRGRLSIDIGQPSGDSYPPPKAGSGRGHEAFHSPANNPPTTMTPNTLPHGPDADKAGRHPRLEANRQPENHWEAVDPGVRRRLIAGAIPTKGAQFVDTGWKRGVVDPGHQMAIYETARQRVPGGGALAAKLDR